MVNLFRQIVSWIRRSIGRPISVKTIQIIQRWDDQGISVIRYKDASVPGLVEIWKIDRHYERFHWFITLVSVAKLREDLAAMRISQHDFIESRGGGVSRQILEQFQEQEDVLATHYWICGFGVPATIVDPQGRAYKTTRITDIQFVAGDFQGFSGAFAGDRYIKLFAYKIVKRLASGEFREMAQHRTWKAAVQAIDWKRWLEGLGQTRIGVDHVLQPRIRRQKK